MAYEQVFEELIDSEHLFVLQCEQSEQMFGEGEAMSVAFELEYESFYPRLQVLPGRMRTARAASRVQRRRLILGAVVIALLVLLMLPIRSLGGSTIAGSAPAAGQEYVVQNGDTLTSIAARVAPSNVGATVQRLAAEIGSTTVVPGEHVLIP
jgi:LysM domain-containing protein